jgi:hypothetical protein
MTMMKHAKLMSLALAGLMSMALSACSVGLITGSGYPVRSYGSGRVYSQGYVRTGYGYASRGFYDPFYGYSSGYGSYYGSPLNSGSIGSWSTFGSGSCDSRDCPSGVIEPATTQEALLPELNQGLELNTDLNIDTKLDLP